jgi:lipopolysaccharide transport system permease protein
MNTSNKSLPAIKQSKVSSDQQPRRIEIELPDKPVIIIEANRNSLSLFDLWQYRDLLYVLTLRDIKVRYKQTVLGILWAIIQPLFMMIIFTFFFGRLAGIPSDGIPYTIFAYAG